MRMRLAALEPTSVRGIASELPSQRRRDPPVRDPIPVGVHQLDRDPRMWSRSPSTERISASVASSIATQDAVRDVQAPELGRLGHELGAGPTVRGVGLVLQRDHPVDRNEKVLEVVASSSPRRPGTRSPGP